MITTIRCFHVKLFTSNHENVYLLEAWSIYKLEKIVGIGWQDSEVLSFALEITIGSSPGSNARPKVIKTEESVLSLDSTAPLGCKGERGGCVDCPSISTVLYWSQLIAALESQQWTSLPTSCSVIPCKQPEIGQRASVYTREIGQCHNAGLPSPSGGPVVK